MLELIINSKCHIDVLTILSSPKISTHCGLVTTEICVKIGSGNGLLPDDTKSLPQPMLISHQWNLEAFIWEQPHSEFPSYYSV